MMQVLAWVKSASLGGQSASFGDQSSYQWPKLVLVAKLVTLVKAYQWPKLVPWWSKHTSGQSSYHGG